MSSSSNSTLHPSLDGCFSTFEATAVFQTFFFSFVLLVPLYVLVLRVGCRRRRKQLNHSEVFTYNLAVLELVNLAGLSVACCSVYVDQPQLLDLCWHIFFIVTPAQALLHLLTCVDRYVAVVHPVAYLRLKQAGGVRNVAVGCVWLLSVGSRLLGIFPDDRDNLFYMVLLAVAAVAISFCSGAVLCVLIRPRPGEVGGHRERPDQSKRRAFSTMVAILGAVLLKLCSVLAAFVVPATVALSFSHVCLVIWSLVWLSLPSSLVQPLLFLQRAAKRRRG
ncbi:uncharacterized protein V6R79_003438 [Siganus canaliculatus]